MPGVQTQSDADDHDEREESTLERLDRNTIELLNELRVAGTGIQVLFAFLLIVPFNTGFKHISSFDRYDYFTTLICIAISAALLIAPSVHHRLLFRRHEKEFLVDLGTRFLIIGMGFLSVGLTGILVLISNVVFGGATPIVVGAIAGVVVGALWFGIPLLHRRKRRAV